MLKRSLLIGGVLLLALLVQAAPPSVSAPITRAVTRPPYEVMLSSAPASGGTVVTLELPAEMLPADGRVPVIDRPGAEHWIRP